jgi:hypothetical protein
VTAAREKFWSGSPLTLGEKVASSLVLRFGILNCINDNLACFENGFDNSGSFLNVGGHRFYVTVTKPFPGEVTDFSDPLYDAGSSCSASNDLGAIIEVLALGDEEGGDLPCTRRSNAFLRRSMLLHPQSRISWTSPSWTYVHPLTSPSTM